MASLAILRRGEFVLGPLPAWGEQPRVQVARNALIEAVRKHSPAVLVAGLPRDVDYLAIPRPILRAAIARVHLQLGKEGVHYTLNAFDCEDYVGQLHQELRKITAAARIPCSPLTAMLSVRQEQGWAGTAPGGAHALAVVLTPEGVDVVEAQNGQTIPLDLYPNRAHAFELGAL